MPLVWEDIVPQLDVRQSHLRDALEPRRHGRRSAPAGAHREPILREIERFLLELGAGFAFVERQCLNLAGRRSGPPIRGGIVHA
jgi:hypothetical protein